MNTAHGILLLVKALWFMISITKGPKVHSPLPRAVDARRQRNLLRL
jgi:hypothetical protein